MVMPTVFSKYVERLLLDGELEDYRKAVVTGGEVLGYKEGPPKDPHSNLPMANIVINIPQIAQSIPVVLDGLTLEVPASLSDDDSINDELGNLDD